MLTLLLAALALIAPPQNPPVVTPEEAAKHVGELVIVKGTITQIAVSVKLTTHIDFGARYPNQVFTATIYRAKQPLFPRVRDYEGKPVQVQGVVRLYKGRPDIILTEPSQFRPAPGAGATSATTPPHP